jgi:uncharacterized protein YkwD
MSNALRRGMRDSSAVLGVRHRTLAIVFLASALLAAPAVARAANCTPDPSWGTPNRAYAEQVAVQLNQQRAANGLGPLLVSPLLTDSAEWKSLHMAYYGYLGHDDPAPPVARAADQRMYDCGYTFEVTIGEDIADGFSTPSSVVAAWMGSAGHRANILGTAFTVMGVGVASDASGFPYWTVDFGGYTDPGSVSAGADPTPAPTPTQPPATTPPPATTSTPTTTASTPTTASPKPLGGATTVGGGSTGGGTAKSGPASPQSDIGTPVSLASDLVAEPDHVRAHPGKVKILHPLRNDKNPDSKPLRILRVLHQPHGSRARVMHGGRSIRLRLPGRAHGMKRLVYLVATATGETARGVVKIKTVRS